MKLLATHEPAEDYDVIVVGSGLGGLVAALTAADSGASVLVLEKSSQVGGTSAVSAGTIWIPANPGMAEGGIDDDIEKARQYVAAVIGGSEVSDAFLDNSNEALSFLRARTLVDLVTVLTYPDYKQGEPGSSYGRAMQPSTYDTKRLGDWKNVLRRDSVLPYSMIEFKKWGSWANFPWDELEQRAADGIVARGAALVGPVLEACIAAGVDVAVEARAEDLVNESGAVRGVVVEGQSIAARLGVVLACGGFEWNAEMMKQHLPMPIPIRCSPPHNTGDGHRMAERIGAGFSSMDEVWWAPMAAVPGQLVDGEQVGRHLRTERQAPGVIIVDKAGDRTVDEAQDYNSLVRSAITAADAKGLPLRMFAIFDQRFLDRYGFLTYSSADQLPDFITKSDTLTGVAESLEIDAVRLSATVARFNVFAEVGVDEDFDRGKSLYDRYSADSTNPYPNGNLAPIEIGPFYGMEFYPGAFGTAGGIATNGRAQALREDGSVIDGLFAVGNVSEQPFAKGYPGAGATLGPAMTLGYVAGQQLAKTRRVAVE